MKTTANTLRELRDYNGEDRIITSYDLQDIVSYESENDNKVYSRLPALDEAIDGFEGGELIAISGKRKNGKTLLAQTLTVNFQRQDIKSLWFSYEMTPKQFLRSFKDEIPYFLCPMSLKAYSMPWVIERILEALAKHGISVVFIDHLHFLFDMARSKNTSLEIGQVVRELKAIAIKYNLIIFLMAHMKKVDFDKEPTDADIRDSSLLSSKSDTGLILWRIKNTENRAVLKVSYSRRKGVMEKKINIIKNDNGLIGEFDNDH
jgi:replicative DNA helicase